MPYPLLTMLHIFAATLALVSGAGAMIFSKGSRSHRSAGNAFFLSMFGMCASGMVLALIKPSMGVALSSVFLFYLVATARLAANRKHGEEAGAPEWAGLFVALTVGIALTILGMEVAQSATKPKDGLPAGAYFFYGALALIACTGDVRLLLRRTLSNSQRIARHLWRMCFAMGIATASLFLGQQKVFPFAWRGSKLFFVPVIAVLLVMIYGLVRVRFTRRFGGKRASFPEGRLPTPEEASGQPA